MRAVLEVERLTTEYAGRGGTVHAVNGVSFETQPGEIVGLMGESGCGKTAIVRSVTGLLPHAGRVVSGSVRLQGEELLHRNRRSLRNVRGAKIGYVGQSPFAALNPILPIGKQFATMIRAHRDLSRSEATALARAQLEAVRIPGVDRVMAGYAHELSGGMAQRVVIAMATVLDPTLIIADEPTTALDVTVQRDIMDLLRELLRAQSRSMLLVSHDLGLVANYCDAVVVLYAGKVVERGPTEQVLQHPAHPYTRMLRAATPTPGKPPTGIPGSVADLVNYPSGCPYHARCPLADGRCATDVPGLRPVLDDERSVSCHHPTLEPQVADAGMR